MKSKKIYTAAAIILLAGLYIAIFCFSAEDAEDSSAASRKVTEMILRVYYRAIGSEGSGVAAGEAAVPYDPALEAVIRKAAHFTEYMCMGFLSYSIAVLWYKPVWKGRFLVLLQLFISAGLDEFHQSFIPGRCASFRDVMIDTAGGAAGILLIVILWKIKKKNRFEQIFGFSGIMYLLMVQ